MSYNWRYHQRGSILALSFIGAPVLALVITLATLFTNGWFLIALLVAIVVMFVLAVGDVWLEPRR